MTNLHFAERNDGWDGMITLSAAASELIGIIPSDGIQSMRIILLQYGTKISRILRETH